MAFFLPEEANLFPHPLLADENGFLAVGANLETHTILSAYSNGIFPWYTEGDPILWWFTSPRCVLLPSEIKISKSMRNIINQGRYYCTVNKNFDQVIESCRSIKRLGQETSWITDDMISAYKRLHKQGIAHSIEVYYENELVGGLYGLTIGKIFSGESMFSNMSNASKYALIYLAKMLLPQDCLLIDCQQSTDHLLSMGAKDISRDEFWKYIQLNKRLSLQRAQLNINSDILT